MTHPQHFSHLGTFFWGCPTPPHTRSSSGPSSKLLSLFLPILPSTYTQTLTHFASSFLLAQIIFCLSRRLFSYLFIKSLFSTWSMSLSFIFPTIITTTTQNSQNVRHVLGTQKVVSLCHGNAKLMLEERILIQKVGIAHSGLCARPLFCLLICHQVGFAYKQGTMNDGNLLLRFPPNTFLWIHYSFPPLLPTSTPDLWRNLEQHQ